MNKTSYQIIGRYSIGQIYKFQTIKNYNSIMNKTFSIQNMETYFRNFVPCLDHRRQPITNFCTQRICLKFMCPECVEIHSRTHTNHPIESIKTCIRKTSEQIHRTIAQLQQQANRNNFLKYKSPEQYENELIKELQQVRKSLIDDINQYFKEKQSEIKRQTSKTHEIKMKIHNLQNELSKALAELHLLDKNLFVNQQCVNTIKKANKIDYQTLLDHFRQSISDVQNQLDVNLKVEMNASKRDQFRRSLNNLIGIRSNKQRHQKQRAINASRSRYTNQRNPLEDEKSPSRVKFIVNPPQLSADRILNQAAFKISSQNYFESQPFVHFFEVSKPNLHILKIRDIKQNQVPKWIVINLNIDFVIPSFNRSVATENGNVYLIGGTIQKPLEKSKAIYQYDPKGQTLKKVSQLNVGRSSQSIACMKKIVYIVGGMDNNQMILKKCQAFNSRTNQCKLIAPCKYATINSTLCPIGQENMVKLGGVDGQGRNSDIIQIYNIAADVWGEIDPTIEDIRGEFGLLSCSGWGTLNDQQVFIFGGYNQQCNNQSSKMSYVLEYKKQSKQFAIKYISMKNLPIAEGFWNPQGVVHNGSIYALQNVDGEDESDCLEDKRNLLIFNGKIWSMDNHNV